MLDIISIFVKPFTIFFIVEIILSIISGALQGDILGEVLENAIMTLGLFVLIIVFALLLGSASPIMLVIALIGAIVILGV